MEVTYNETRKKERRKKRNSGCGRLILELNNREYFLVKPKKLGRYGVFNI
jgi:hypothetical protein